MLTLEKIAKRHNEWLRIAKYVGAPIETINDIVQDMYLKLAEINEREGNLNRITNHAGDINTVYIFKLLTNETIKYVKKSAKTTQLPEQIEISITEANMSEIAYNDFMGAISDCINSMHEYDKILIELHFIHNLSMRKIENKTGIPTHSIFNTLKNAKQKIKQETNQKYNEFRDSRNDRETEYWIGGCDSENNESEWD